MEEKIESNKLNILNNIKSKIILKSIIGRIDETKLLNIIRYNKKIQKRLNINLNNYKEAT